MDELLGPKGGNFARQRQATACFSTICWHKSEGDTDASHSGSSLSVLKGLGRWVGGGGGVGSGLRWERREII